MKGNTFSNVKRHLSEEDKSIAVQAYLNTSNKLDTVINVAKTPVKVTTSVIRAKDVIQKSKNIGSKKISRPVLIKQPTGKINKKYLLNKGVAKLSKNSIKIASSSKNRVVENLGDKSDGNLGVQAYLKVDRDIRVSVDAVKSTKNVAVGSSKVITNSNKLLRGSSSLIKERITDKKRYKYKNIKKNISKANKIKTSTKKTRVNNVLTKNARKGINKNHIFKSKTLNIAKSAVSSVKKSIKTILMIKNPIVLTSTGILILLILVSNSVSGSMVSILSQNYFMADEDIALKYKDKVELLDNALREEISDLKDDNKYDSTRVVYIGDNQKISTNFNEIFAIASVKFEQNLTCSNNEKKFIDKIYSEIYDIKISTENYTIKNSEGKEITKKRKIITVYSYDMETVMDKINFDDEQERWARTLVTNFSEQFPKLAIQYGELTQEEIRNLIENAPKLTSKQQEKLYDTALSLVGKVKYFWGGKSSVGWNDEWGESTLVTSPGNDTTGKYRPFGLDCSGYVDWVYKTSGISNILSGGGTSYQWGKSYPISNDDLQVGDLAFLQMPNSSGINHVGIYVGKDKDNNNLYAHCQWGTGVTVDGYKGFKYFRRVVKFE
ncbi:C40 family peptidase [Sedimentibacter acidaminivorans]|nr:NlpC/P60 family protein [Sedimentibacter acidaminivorans]